MTVICEEIGDKYGLQYNPSKTVCILYARNAPKVKPRVDLCGTELQCVNTVNHLGNYLDSNLSEISEIIKKKGEEALIWLLRKPLIHNVHILWCSCMGF